MKVKITQGNYGYVCKGSKFPVLKQIGDIVDVSNEEADRLVDLGVAEYVYDSDIVFSDTDEIDSTKGAIVPEGDNDTESEELNNNDDTVVTDGDAEEDEEEDAEEGLDFSEEGLNKLTVSKLTDLAKEMELDVSKCKLKSDFVKAILTAVDNGAIIEIAPPVIPE